MTEEIEVLRTDLANLRDGIGELLVTDMKRLEEDVHSLMDSAENCHTMADDMLYELARLEQESK